MEKPEKRYAQEYSECIRVPKQNIEPEQDIAVQRYVYDVLPSNGAGPEIAHDSSIRYTET